MTTGSRRVLLVFAALALASGVSGCGKSMRQAIGIDQNPPDEFAVLTRAPLAMPPDYGLRPPSPGERRPQEVQVKDEAREALVRGAAVADKEKEGVGGLTSGEAALLKHAGAAKADPGIRAEVNTESAKIAASEKSLVDKIVFWRKPLPPGTVLDAEKEARRLRENAALGSPPVAGATPVIKRRERGWLEGIF